MPRILVLDIETMPAIAEVWSLWDQNIGLSQLRQAAEVAAVGMKWHGEKGVDFVSTHRNGREEMLSVAASRLDEADIVVHFNGTTFDIPHLQREFVLAGIGPVAPFAQVDLLRVARRQFRFMSNKLDHIAQQLGVGAKLKHEGHELWSKCMAGDAAAWGRMERYCKRDVEITDKVYSKLLPWITGHPSVPLIDGVAGKACPRCASDKLHSRGHRYLTTGKYSRYQCQECKSWSYGTAREGSVPLRSIS